MKRMPRTGKQQSAISNRSGNQSPIDAISALLQEVRKQNRDKDTGGKFYGFVLYPNKISCAKFNQIFENNEEFKREVYKTGGAIEADPSGHILEMFVEVPELSDFFPRPDLNIIMDIIKDKKIILQKISPLRSLVELPNIDGSGTPTPSPDKLKRGLEEIRKTMNIITMYPRVYKYCKKSEYYPMGTSCELEFPYDKNMGFPSMGYGYFRGLIGGFKKSKGGGLNEEIKNIIEKAKKEGEEQK